MKPQILIVDDELENLNAICDLLDDDTYTVLRTTRAERAYAIALDNRPNLIITDWEMPGMTGIELIQKLKSNPQTTAIPIIMCTGVMTSAANLKTALDAGAVDYIRKPVEPLELVARVSSMLKLSAAFREIVQQKIIIEQEKEKSDRLLLNILPAKVAHDLKETGATHPESFDNVTVYFSDIVGFTPAAEQLSPERLIAELNDIFTGFDDIMTAHGCERIETVGDAYLAVCGMPVPNDRHAAQMTLAAQEIIRFMHRRNQAAAAKGRREWQIRIGLHSGKVVGGVVGIRKYSYNVFGDAINTASRVEANSQPMRINISEATYQLIKGQFQFEARDPLEVKGKGLMKMYFVKQDF